MPWQKEREPTYTPHDGEALISTFVGAGYGAKRTHQSKLDWLCGAESEEYYALIHTAIPDKKAYEIPKAKGPVDAEWDKLIRIGSFGFPEVMYKNEVIAKHKKSGEQKTFWQVTIVVS